MGGSLESLDIFPVVVLEGEFRYVHTFKAADIDSNLRKGYSLCERLSSAVFAEKMIDSFGVELIRSELVFSFGEAKLSLVNKVED